MCVTRKKIFQRHTVQVHWNPQPDPSEQSHTGLPLESLSDSKHHDSAFESRRPCQWSCVDLATSNIWLAHWLNECVFAVNLPKLAIQLHFVTSRKNNAVKSWLWQSSFTGQTEIMPQNVLHLFFSEKIFGSFGQMQVNPDSLSAPCAHSTLAPPLFWMMSTRRWRRKHCFRSQSLKLVQRPRIHVGQLASLSLVLCWRLIDSHGVCKSNRLLLAMPIDWTCTCVHSQWGFSARTNPYLVGVLEPLGLRHFNFWQV